MAVCAPAGAAGGEGTTLLADSLAVVSASAGSRAGWGTSSGDTISTVMASGGAGGKGPPPAKITTGVMKATWATNDMARPASAMSFGLMAGPPFSVSFPAFSSSAPGKGRKRRSERPFTRLNGNACLPDFAKGRRGKISFSYPARVLPPTALRRCRRDGLISHWLP
jgi:hypothetical protein